jgi:hypothetical protein
LMTMIGKDGTPKRSVVLNMINMPVEESIQRSRKCIQ